MVFFFFSSRRRHTRSKRDWSSDVCSSDLGFRRAMARNVSVTPFEAGRWAKLLRSAAGYQAFRRVHTRGMVPTQVVGFLLYDGEFPRSVRLCIGEIDQLLHGLRQRHGLRGGSEALELVDGMRG